MPVDKIIRNCDPDRAFDCPTHWDALPAGATAGVRTCGACGKRVRACFAAAEVAAANAAGERTATWDLDAKTWPLGTATASLRQLIGNVEAARRDNLARARSRDEATDSKLREFLSNQYQVPAIDLRATPVPPEAVAAVSADFVRRHWAVPINVTATAITLATSDPSDPLAPDELATITGKDVELAVASLVPLVEAMERFYGVLIEPAG